MLFLHKEFEEKLKRETKNKEEEREVNEDIDDVSITSQDHQREIALRL